MRIPRGRVAVIVVGAALVVAGVAAAAAVKTILLHPGQCVTVAKTRVCAVRKPAVTVTVTQVSAPTPAPPPTSPTFISGHYVGTDTASEHFNFDVSRSQVFNIDFGFNGECQPRGTSAGSWLPPGPFSLGSDGRFTAQSTGANTSGGTTTVAVNGRVFADGSAAGTYSVSGTVPGFTCSDSGSWTAHVQ